MPGACPPPEVPNGYGAESPLCGYEEATRAKSRSTGITGVFPEESPAATLGKDHCCGAFVSLWKDALHLFH